MKDVYVIETSLVNGNTDKAVYIGADKAKAFFDLQVTRIVFGRIASVYLFQGFVDTDGRVRHFAEPLNVYEG